MITRITKGNCFRGVLAYALMANKQPHVLCTTLKTLDPTHWATEFELQASRNWRVKERVYHYVKSLAPGEHLSDEQWSACIKEDAQALGFDQYVAVLHRDRAHDHADIVVNAVLSDGRTWAQRQDRVKLRATANAQEIRYGLTRTRAVSDLPSVGKEEIERAQRLFAEGKAKTPIPAKILVREFVLAACAQASSETEFEALLAQQGIAMRNRVKDGVIVGISFGLDGQAFSGSSIGMPLKSVRSRFSHDNSRIDPTSTAPSLAKGISGRNRLADCRTTHASVAATPYVADRAGQLPSDGGCEGTGGAEAYPRPDSGQDRRDEIIHRGTSLLVLILFALANLSGGDGGGGGGGAGIRLHMRRRRPTTRPRNRLPI